MTDMDRGFMERIDSTEQKLFVLLVNKQSKSTSEKNDLKRSSRRKNDSTIICLPVICLWVVRISHEKVKIYKIETIIKERKISLI